MQLDCLRKISVLAMVVSLQNDVLFLSVSENAQISFMNGLSSCILSIHEGNDPLDIQPVLISIVLLPEN